MVIYNGQILAEPNDPDTILADGTLPDGQPIIGDGYGKKLTTVALEASRLIGHNVTQFDQSLSFAGQANKYLMTDANGNLVWR